MVQRRDEREENNTGTLPSEAPQPEQLPLVKLWTPEEKEADWWNEYDSAINSHAIGSD
jgi:hypothetical protein